MSVHHQRAISGAAVPLVIGTVGLLKLGHWDWAVVTVMAIAAAWMYRSQLLRSRTAATFELPPQFPSN